MTGRFISTALIAVTALMGATRTRGATDSYAPLRLYEGTWQVTQTTPVGKQPDRLVNDCAQIGHYFACQQTVNGKPGAVISVSPGAIGGFGANHHLRQSLVFLDVPTLAQPEAYLGAAATLFDAEGRIANEGTRGFMRKFLDAYTAWVAVHSKATP